ncbi:MAG: xanthine dehydrogenase family protein subunit M [Burkholderiales bacterium]|jgi:aerobic carbon-monoxide dehydrogenase medium subunit|nr:xanthine dehydrogenase family protein subunit M [Burkholderiales bacterium]
MIPFELAEPRTLKAAMKLLDAGDESVRVFGGGTALMLMMKAGVFQPTRLISLRGIEKRYAKVTSGQDGSLHIGALVTLSALGRTAAVKKRAPVIIDTLRTLSNVRIRNVATLGGHLAHADPHMDLPPVLMALDAQVITAATSGARTLAVADLFTGYYETALARNELISEVIVPAQSGRRSAYVKLTTRAADDWPTLGIAVSLQMNGDTVQDARFVVSAATEKPLRLPGAEAVLHGATISDAMLARVGEAAAVEAELTGDARGSAAYKTELLRVHAGRAVRKALAA